MCTAFPKHIGVLKLCMHTQHPKWKIFTKFQDEINSLTSISSCLNIEYGSNWTQHISLIKMCIAFPKHICALKLCMHTQHPKWKIFTKFQEEINSLTSISSCLNIENGSNWPHDKMCTAFPKHICVSKLYMHTQHPKWKYSPNFKIK